MAGGTPVGRSWVVMLHNGMAVIDWGDGLFLDAFTGNFVQVSEDQISHRAQDSDLDWLIRVGRVEGYNRHQVYFTSLPERSIKTLD